MVDGKPNWLNRNDIDWETCHLNQVKGQSGILTLAIEENEGHFVTHHAFLYRCDTGPNPFYLRYTTPDGRSVLIKLQWPTILDENYLFATKALDRDHIGYGFRIAVASSTQTRWHYRRFYFTSLRSLNRFVLAQSFLMNGQKNVLHKADFFKAPRIAIAGVDELRNDDNLNAYGDHKSYGHENKDLLQAGYNGQPSFPQDDPMEDGHYVRNTVTQYPVN
eukprot:CAMPEP_0175119688 /NCGR_PEP_ID=MMETSP0087-20121206/202_1 /TAXON_ID=136419 /ORGANISM="Unknown Unknown, Strain D1" /LENGTH=218 /DNA_ID=CAMNT_0016401047 /DNA_START=426 /DNA_END=1082 /DNA_ORIENTATION=+